MINHLTLNTGHFRLSAEDEVPSEVLEVLTPWLTKTLAATTDLGQSVTLPATALQDYSAVAINIAQSLQISVAKNGVRLVTFWVSNNESATDWLWDFIPKQWKFERDQPSSPCCIVYLHPELAIDSATEWLGDFERCIAWTWVKEFN